MTSETTRQTQIVDLPERCVLRPSRITTALPDKAFLHPILERFATDSDQGIIAARYRLTPMTVQI